MKYILLVLHLCSFMITGNMCGSMMYTWVINFTITWSDCAIAGYEIISKDALKTFGKMMKITV
jgi:hypothetical protein